MRLHASCVALGNRGLLILGKSGSGKSSLALEFLALGAKLVSDDQTILKQVDGSPRAHAPDQLFGKIEARGIGILAADAQPSARVELAVDLDQIELDRIPKSRMINLLGLDIPLLHFVDTRSFPYGVLQYLKGGRVDM